jgi:hypothetical protein
MISKLVDEKCALELERDDSDKIDGRIFRSAFTSLCVNLDTNKSVRTGILSVMSEMLGMSEEEKIRSGLTGNGSRDDDRLAKKFLDFLEDEIGQEQPPSE